MVALIAATELARPGVAGPLSSPWTLEHSGMFESEGGVNLKDWITNILVNRVRPQRDVLPVSCGIDFFAHDLFNIEP